jgi:hypothetical protein
MGHSSPRLVVLLVAAALGCASPGGDSARTERELLQQVETSGTAADHAALAAFYRERAEALRDRAAHYEFRARRYLWRGSGGVRSGRFHSRALARKYRKLAAEAEALAELHLRAAAEAAEPN